MLSPEGKVADEKNFIYFNNPKSVEGSVSYSGDNKTGAGDGDDEQIKVDLAIVPANVQKISFGITIYEAQERNQNFGQVSNAYVRVVNEASGEELIRYDLGEDFSIETAIVVCDLYRNGSEWKFNAIGSGYQNGLSGLCKDFGLDV
jgi:tellurium resistance protein TerD